MEPLGRRSLAATLFAVHTTNTETLNLMHARSELLSAMGVVGSFLVYLYLPRSRRTYLYLLPMVVGALAKTPAVMFAPLFLVYVVPVRAGPLGAGSVLAAIAAARAARRSGRACRRSSWASVVFLASSAMDAADASTTAAATGCDYLRTQPFVWLHYGRLFFLPVGLTADTDWTLIPTGTTRASIAGLLFVALLLRVALERVEDAALAARGLRPRLVRARAAAGLQHRSARRGRRTSTGCSFPTSGCRSRWSGALTLLVERWSNARPRLRPLLTRAALVLALVAIGGNAVGTYERNKVWRTEETLWRDVTEKSPANGRGLMNYGLTQMAQGQVRGGQAALRAGRSSTTRTTPRLEINLGIVTDRLGQPAVAESHFQRALQLQPNDPSSAFFLRALAGRAGARGRSDPAPGAGHRPEPGDRGRQVSAPGRLCAGGADGGVEVAGRGDAGAGARRSAVEQYLNDRGRSGRRRRRRRRPRDGREPAEHVAAPLPGRRFPGQYRRGEEGARAQARLRRGPQQHRGGVCVAGALGRSDRGRARSLAAEAGFSAGAQQSGLGGGRETEGEQMTREEQTTHTVMGWSWSPWRCVAGAAVVALLACTAVGCGGETAVTRPAADTNELQVSFEHYRAGRYQEASLPRRRRCWRRTPVGGCLQQPGGTVLGTADRRSDPAAQEAIRLRPDYQLARNNLAWIQRE